MSNAQKVGLHIIVTFWGAVLFALGWLVISMTTSVAATYTVVVPGFEAFAISRWWDVVFFPVHLNMVLSVVLWLIPALERAGHDRDDLFVGLVTGLVTGLVVGFVPSFVTGLVIGLVVSFVAGLVAGLVVGLVTGLVAGLVVGLVTGFVTGLVAGLGIGLVTGLVVGFVAGLVFLIKLLVDLHKLAFKRFKRS